jgi:(1->4)-alpha-D-glucan 1-alpha-D-glucosylmutase
VRSPKRDPVTNKAALVYYDAEYPLNPGTYSEDKSIAELHEAQSWRLMSWREAPKQLSWRRFFEITGLVGVRVEDDAVFDDTHRLILELVHAGVVDGLRIDHVDGLADPLGYLQRLRRKPGPTATSRLKKSSRRENSSPPTGRYPAPPATSLSPRWRKCWSTTITCRAWRPSTTKRWG